MIIFPLISLLLITGFTRYITGAWSSPGVFFSLCWSFFLLVPIVLAPDYKTDHLALWFITIFSMSLSSGSIIAYSKDKIKSEYATDFQNNFNHNFLYYSLIIFCSVSFIGLYLLLKYSSSIYSINNYSNNWMLIPNMIAVDRYSGILNYPFIIKYSLYFIYPANLLGGLIFGQNNKSIKIKFFAVLPIFLAIFLGIIEGARTSILLGLVMFFSAWLSTFMFKHQKIINIKRLFFKTFLGIGVFIMFFTVFFIFIQWLRQGMDTIIVDLLIERIRAYFFGYLAAFSKWLSGNIEFNFDPILITFAGPFNLFGIMERPLGFYNSMYIDSTITTNIFTAFRGIIIDFSMPGAIIIAFIIGFISQIIFQKNNKKTLLSTLPISMFYAFTIYSPLISIFHYNSILFSWIILFFILIISKNDPLDNYC